MYINIYNIYIYKYDSHRLLPCLCHSQHYSTSMPLCGRANTLHVHIGHSHATATLHRVFHRVPTNCWPVESRAEACLGARLARLRHVIVASLFAAIENL